MKRAERAVLTVEKERRNIPTCYDVCIDEAEALRDSHPGDVYSFGFDMFVLGFVKGRRCEAAQRKKKEAACNAKKTG